MKLNVHVLDLQAGESASGVRVEVFHRSASAPVLLASLATATNGRFAEALDIDEALLPGRFKLVFAAGDYFAAQSLALPNPRFIDEIAIELGLAAGQHYHLPLLITPWSYSVYRGC